MGEGERVSKTGGIASEVIDRVREATDIVKLISRSVKLKKDGSAWIGKCPFHDEKTPSFRVDVARRRYRCFGCDKGGDVFEWLIAHKGMSFPDAVRELAAEAAIEVPAAESLPPPEPGRVDVAVEWTALRGVTDAAALTAWLVRRGVHATIAEPAGRCEGVVFAPDRPYGALARLMSYSRVGIALRDEHGKVVDVERRSHLPPHEIEERGFPKSQRLKPEDRGELRRKVFFGDLSKVRETVLKGRKVYIAEGGPDWWVAETLCQIAGDGIALGAAANDLPDLGGVLRRMLMSMPDRQGPPPVVVLIPDLGDAHRTGERAMLDVAAQLVGVAVCRWAPPVAEHRAEWCPRLEYYGKRWRAAPGPGSGVKADLGDLAALPAGRVRDLLDASWPVLDEGPRPEGSSDPWRPCNFDRLRRFIEGLPLATITDALQWRVGKNGLAKYTAPESTWWLGDLVADWLGRRGARFGHDEKGTALVYWPQGAPGEKRLHQLHGRQFARVLYKEGRVSVGSQGGQDVLQAIQALCLTGRPLPIESWSYATRGEVRMHLHDDLDRVAVARIDGVHVEPNAAAQVLHETSDDVRPIAWVPDVDLRTAITLLNDRVAKWFTCDGIDRVLVLAWAVLSLARQVVTLRPILTFNGPAGVGKSVAARLLAVLLYGWPRLLARPTPISLYADGRHPITAIDNVEERNRAAVEDFLLIAGTQGFRSIGTKEGGTHKQPVDTFALLTSIVVSGRIELMERMLVIENARQHGSSGFIEEEVISALKTDRSQILCGLLRLWSDRIWRRWDDVRALTERVSQTHFAWRQRESLAAMAIIGAELGALDPRITTLSAEALLDVWLARLEERLGSAAVETDPIVFGLQHVLRAWNRVVWGPNRYWQQWLEEEVASCQPVYLHHAGESVTEKVKGARVRRRHTDWKGVHLEWPVVAGFIGTFEDLHSDIVRALKPAGLADRFVAEIPEGSALKGRWSQVASKGWCKEQHDRPRGEGGSRPYRFRFFTLEAIGGDGGRPDDGPPAESTDDAAQSIEADPMDGWRKRPQ